MVDITDLESQVSLKPSIKAKLVNVPSKTLTEESTQTGNPTMESMNETEVGGFFLLGFYEFPDLQLTLFLTFLLIYLMALMGNLTIITVIFMEPQLHTPMYVFLCDLSCLDITFTSSVIPKLLDICLTGKHSITYKGCITQTYFFVICVVAEYFLLAVMAYDRYLAICQPLRYLNLMNPRACFMLTVVPWFCGVLDSTYLSLLSQYSFCQSNVINHLFCDIKPLLKLSCSDTQNMELATQVSGALFGFTPLMFILISYIYIIYAILRIRSNEGKQKAFSTCSSHLTVVILFFGIILAMYMRPKSAYSIEQDKVFSVLYTSCIPMLNPFIYSLRNKDVKQALGKLRRKVLR
ncbi:olfactory receptor 8D1-like [Discoglossus pictus]